MSPQEPAGAAEADVRRGVVGTLARRPPRPSRGPFQPRSRGVCSAARAHISRGTGHAGVSQALAGVNRAQRARRVLGRQHRA